MPVEVLGEIRALTQQEFGAIAYEVVEAAFSIQNEMGRLFDEDVYRDALAARVVDSVTEVCVQVRFDDFLKEYHLDLLVCGGAPFELKAVRKLVPTHRRQLLNYLMLVGLSHGKLINFRTESLEHEFVNTQLVLSDRTAFQVVQRNWQALNLSNGQLMPWFIDLLRDVGAGLDNHLYQAAISYFLGINQNELPVIDIYSGGRRIGQQRIHLASPDWAVKVTTLDDDGLSRYERQLDRFLNHTKLRGVSLINIRRDEVSFATIEKQ